MTIALLISIRTSRCRLVTARKSNPRFEIDCTTSEGREHLKPGQTPASSGLTTGTAIMIFSFLFQSLVSYSQYVVEATQAVFQILCSKGLYHEGRLSCYQLQAGYSESYNISFQSLDISNLNGHCTRTSSAISTFL